MRTSWLLRALLLSTLYVVHLPSQAEDAVEPLTEVDAGVAPTEDFESRLAMVESQLAHKEAISSCRVFSTAGHSSLYGGIELAALTANTGSLSGSILAISGRINEPFDLNAAPRIYAGYENARGLGFRGTYWQFDQMSDVSAAGIVTGLEMHALDLEGTIHTQFYRSDVMFSGGLRYGKVAMGTGQNAGLGLAFESEGLGPTIATQLRRGLGSSNFGIYGGGRASILLTENQVSIPSLLSISAEESSMQVIEIQGGLEHRRCFRNYDLLTQFGGEVQNWQPGAIAGIIAPNVALYGPTFRIGFDY